MGIEVIICNLCNEGFMDAMDYGYCATCEEVLCNRCNERMQGKYGQIDEESDFAGNYGDDNPITCDVCTGEQIEETEFVRFLIKKIGTTRKALEEEFKLALKADKENKYEN